MSAIDDIVLSPDPRLKKQCAPIEHIDDTVRKLAQRMLEDMYAAGGCGLAAPQVGENIRLVVIDVDYGDAPKNPYVLINPTIVESSQELVAGSEGCLSFPGISVTVERPNRVVVHALNLDGDMIEYTAENNLMCVCLQHEIDHLVGTTMIDHLSPTARARALREYEQAREAGAQPGDTEV